MKNKFTKEEVEGLIVMVAYNRDDAKMQEDSGVGYTQSINLKVKLDEMLEEIRQEEWRKNIRDKYNIAFIYEAPQFLKIVDYENDRTCLIPQNLVYAEKVALYNIVDCENEADEIERMIGEQHMCCVTKNNSDLELMREDLETLRETDEEFAFGNYGTNGFITKDSDIEAFNKACFELIDSFDNYFEDYKKEIIGKKAKVHKNPATHSYIGEISDVFKDDDGDVIFKIVDPDESIEIEQRYIEVLDNDNS